MTLNSLPFLLVALLAQGTPQAPPATGTPSQPPAAGTAQNPEGRGRGRGGFVTPVYDSVAPEIPASIKGPNAVLIFSKTNGYREEPAIKASNDALAAIAKKRGWPSFVTENAAVMNAERSGTIQARHLEQHQRRRAHRGAARRVQDLARERRRVRWHPWRRRRSQLRVGVVSGDAHRCAVHQPLVAAAWNRAHRGHEEPDHQRAAAGVAAHRARRVVRVQGQPAIEARVPHPRGRRRDHIRSRAIDDGSGSSDGVDALRRARDRCSIQRSGTRRKHIRSRTTCNCSRTRSRGPWVCRVRPVVRRR